MQDDRALLQAAQTGNRQALSALLERHQAQIYRFGLKLCRDPEDAKDILQDTLLTMARGVGEFRGASSLSTWIYAIARSHCIKKRRRSKFAPQQERSLEHDADAAQLQHCAPAPDDALASKELDAQVQGAVQALDPMYRDVFVLRDMEGLSAAEVAEVMGLSVDAVKSRLHRARKAVRDRLLGSAEVAQAPAAGTECPDVVTMWSQHLEDEISAADCASMERHLAQCPRCHSACDSLKRTLARCRTTNVGPVPPAVQQAVRTALRDFLAG